MLASRLLLALEVGKTIVRNTYDKSNPSKFDTIINLQNGMFIARGYGVGEYSLEKFALDIITAPKNYTIKE